MTHLAAARDSAGYSRLFPPAGMGWMTTYTGLRFNHAKPTPEMISIEDIAHHLSLIGRWGGASRQFISVAQHSVLVSNLCPPELALWGLLHDAAEAYYADVVRPLKLLIPEYKELETRGMFAIAERFGLSWPEPLALKEFDNRATSIESRDLMHPSERVYDARAELVEFDDLPEERIDAQTPREAEVSFLFRFNELTGAALPVLPEPPIVDRHAALRAAMIEIACGPHCWTREQILDRALEAITADGFE